jgi:hypothetical protein
VPALAKKLPVSPSRTAQAMVTNMHMVALGEPGVEHRRMSSGPVFAPTDRAQGPVTRAIRARQMSLSATSAIARTSRRTPGGAVEGPSGLAVAGGSRRSVRRAAPPSAPGASMLDLRAMSASGRRCSSASWRRELDALPEHPTHVSVTSRSRLTSRGFRSREPHESPLPRRSTDWASERGRAPGAEPTTPMVSPGCPDRSGAARASLASATSLAWRRQESVRGLPTAISIGRCPVPVPAVEPYRDVSARRGARRREETPLGPPVGAAGQ